MKEISWLYIYSESLYLLITKPEQKQKKYNVSISITIENDLPRSKPLLCFKYLRLQYSRESQCMGIEHHGYRPSVPTNLCLWCAPQADSIHVMLSTASSYVFYVTIYVPCWICILLFNRISIYSARSTIQIWRITLIVNKMPLPFTY